MFHYQRSTRTGEPRLAGLRSIGIGGHLNQADGTTFDGRKGLDRAIRRELSEEIQIAGAPAVQLVGVINDDSNPVGRVHLGLVAVVRLDSPDVTLRDPALTGGQFDSPAILASRLDEFETWSRLCLPAIAGLV